jgi:hypothetical protein
MARPPQGQTRLTGARCAAGIRALWLIDETRAPASKRGRAHHQTRVALSREISLPDLSTSQPQLEQFQPP